MRRVQGSCTYGLQYMTHPRRLTDAEVKDKAKNLEDEEAAFFGESQAYFKLYNSAQVACFYFENNETSLALTSKFNFQLENLSIVDEKPNADSFVINLAPG